jgi:hypothetical protein
LAAIARNRLLNAHPTLLNADAIDCINSVGMDVADDLTPRPVQDVVLVNDFDTAHVDDDLGSKGLSSFIRQASA